MLVSLVTKLVKMLVKIIVFLESWKHLKTRQSKTKIRKAILTGDIYIARRKSRGLSKNSDSHFSNKFDLGE